MSNSTVVARVESVSKRFIMHKEKTLKERVLNFKNARSNREDFWALRDIDLEIHAGTTVGLVGHNGSGKSTLLKILGGIIEPTTGQVFRKGRIAPLLELGAGFHPDLSGRENIYLNAAILGLTKAETDRHFDSIVDFSGIESFIDTQVKFYSSGMYVRLAFSIAVHVDPDFLLVDEVLAVGDQPFQQKCMAKISEFQRDGRTIAFVSHSAAQISSLCDRVVVLEKGVILHNGDTDEGLRVLRSGYARMQQEQSSITSDGITPALEINNLFCEVTNSNLKITVPFHISKKIPDWKLGLTFWTSGDQKLFSVMSDELGTKLPTNVASGELVFNLPEIPLVSGNYSVSYGAVTQDGSILDSRNPAVSFEINDHSKSLGPLKVSCNAQLCLS